MARVTQLPATTAAAEPVGSGFQHDYVDVFQLEAGIQRSPEAWARTVAEAAGWRGQLIWKGLLQLDLRAEPGRFGGWRVTHNDDRAIRLEARSWTMEARLLLSVQGDTLTVSTFIQYRNAAGRLLWPQAAKGHRSLMPRLLNSTLSRAKRTR